MSEPGTPPEGAARIWNEHSNQLGDWCPWSGTPAAGGACPAMCPASSAIAAADPGEAVTAGRQVKIMIRRVVQGSVTLPYGDARKVFGLGGTPDDELPSMLAGLLAARQPEQIMRLLLAAGVDVELERDLSVELTGLTDPADGGEFVPKPAGSAVRRPGPAQPGSAGQAAPDRLAERVAGPEGHVCLGCGCRIAEGLREVPVPGRRYGVRYRHADSGDCADALRAPQPNRALIGRYEALPGFSWAPANSDSRPRRQGRGPGRPGGKPGKERRGRGPA